MTLEDSEGVLPGETSNPRVGITKHSLGNSIFSGTEQLFPGTQAFASPPDLASSGGQVDWWKLVF